MVCMWIGASTFGQPNEYLIKGILLEKFTRFVEWPEFSNVNNELKPFIIGIIGENPFHPDLESLYKDRQVKSKAVKIFEISRVQDIKKCNLLFISRSEKYRLSQIINSIQDQPILTISDSKEFSGKGVIINFRIDEDKIRFEIDENAVHNAGLYMSHLLLKEAEIIHPVRKN